MAFPDEPRIWQAFFIALRRMCGGFEEGVQLALRDTYDPFVAPKECGLKRSKKIRLEPPMELLELLASLERVPTERRMELGGWVLEQTWTKRDPRLFAALGRLGSRLPAYASKESVVPAEVAEQWLGHLLREDWSDAPLLQFAAVELSRRTLDGARDVSLRARTEVLARLSSCGASEDLVRAVREVVPRKEGDRAAFFGEALPLGLSLGAKDP